MFFSASAASFFSDGKTPVSASDVLNFIEFTRFLIFADVPMSPLSSGRSFSLFSLRTDLRYFPWFPRSRVSKCRTVKILSCLKSDNILTNTMALNLVAPVSKYENEDQAWFGDMGKTVMMSTRLVSDDDYQAAVQFFKANGREFTNYEDHFSMMRQIRSVLGAIKIGGTFFIIMFAVIAIINMVNIVSTGILNRRSELASMQCVGMTDGQLYGMTIIECAQFVIIACVAAIVLCALATWGTHVFLHDVLTLEEEEVARGYVGIFSSVPRILLATGAAFVAALAASVFPLRRMQRETLVDRIRTVE